MGYNNKDLITPLLLYSTNYTTSHSLAHCNISERRNDEQQIIIESTGEQKEREICMQSRWNPTPEQMMALEEVYKSGTRTPTTQQIQELASTLQKYGRIEGKNVFYWFQNHKSRERLKRRRPDQQERHAFNNVHECDTKDSSVLRRKGDHRVIHTKTCFSASLTHPQNNDIDDEKGLEGKKEATWQHQINTSDCNSHLMMFTCKGSQETEHEYNVNEEEEERRKSRTLDLFPVIENQEKTGCEEKNTKPNQFCYYYYEFMPLMN